MKQILTIIAIINVFSLSVRSQDKITAKLNGTSISLSDGRTFNIKQSKLFGAGAAIEIKAPLGASVTVTQDDGKDIYTNEVPFTYDIKDYELYDKYFKLDVTEGNNKWSIKLKNDNGFKMIIEEGEAGSVTPAVVGVTTSDTQTTSPAVSGNINWVFYTEEGENFTLYVEGEKINASPSGRVTASNITGNVKQVRIAFEKSAIPELLKKFPVISGGNMSVVIKKSKKGEYQFRVVDAPRQ